MYRVVKRDNSVAEFDIKKISEAIIKAFEATEKQYNNSVIDLLAPGVHAAADERTFARGDAVPGHGRQGRDAVQRQICAPAQALGCS